MSRSQLIRSVQADSLQVNVYHSRSEMGRAAGAAAAGKIRERLAKQDRVRVVFAAAPSQQEMLAKLREEPGIDWSRVTAFHMDEYIGLPSDSPQRFSAFLHEHLFRFVDLGEIHLIDSANAAEAECRRYASLLQEAPIDIVCLGIGENGHLAFNDPPVADFADPETVKIVELDDICRQQQVNDGCFATFDDVPTHAITLTIPALLSGAALICTVPGPTKREAVRRTLHDPIMTSCPSTIMRNHPDCTMYTDRDAYGS